MLEGKLCERCSRKVQPSKAIHKQTKYCVECARIKKRENTENPWTPEEKRAYMRAYMRGYRAQTRFSCVVWFLPFLGASLLPDALNLSFEDIRTGIIHAEILAIEVTSLVVAVVYCIRHLMHAWKGDDKDKEKEK